MKKRIYLLYAIAIACLASVACSKGSGTDDPPGNEETVKLQTHATLGSYLTDKDGRTLYYFANDSVTVNTCTGGCVALWPVFYASGLADATLGEGLQPEDFGEITTPAGDKQTTYKGRPLYYYAPSAGGINTPESPGETKGEGVGGNWFVAKPDYTIMLSRAQLVGADGKNYVFSIATPTPVYTEGNGKSTYFTDAKGVSLYIFKPDKQNTNTFTESDFSNNGVWPIYEMENIVVPSILDKSSFGVITVHGRKQLTYKGWPLYYFGQDEMKMGATKGVSVPAPGIWPVATKDLADAPPAS